MLIRLFSDTNLFKDVLFHNGINIILGKYSGDKEARGINGIGKSSLIRLISFTLLSGKAEKLFNKKKYDFLRNEEHCVTLEFQVKNTKYFIERSFSNLKTVFFGKIPDNLEEYDKSDMPKILEGLFFPVENNEVFFQGKRFGTLLEFFVKDDLQNQRRFDPFNFVTYTANVGEKALYNFYLLHLKTKTLVEYNEIAKESQNYTKTKNTLSKKIKADTGKDVEQFRTEKLKIEKTIEEIEKSLKEYNFFKSHEDLEEKLQNVIEKINIQSNLYHSTNRKLEKLKKSYKGTNDVDVEQIKKLYNETLASFGDFVKKSLDEVIAFKRNLLRNRKKYLIEEENKLEKIISGTLKELKKLEKERSRLFSFLKEKGALDKVETTYKELVSEKTSLERNTAIIKEIDDIDSILSDSAIVLATLKRDMSSHLATSQNYLDELRLLFQDILEHAIYLDEEFDDSYFNITNIPSPRKNQLPFSFDLEMPRADALGQERLKVVAYDLMVFLKSRSDKRNLPNFLIHDGAFHGISHKTRCNVLNYMYHSSLSLQNFQYIVTFNEDEIATDDRSKYGTLDFDVDKHTIAEFSDVENKTIFKKFF